MTENSAVSVCWSYFNQNQNQISNALFGNRKRLTYTYGFWNCRRKLISPGDYETNKLIDLKMIIQKHRPYAFSVIESDIFNINSNSIRKKYSTQEVIEKLRIEAYEIVFLKSKKYSIQAMINFVVTFLKKSKNT